MSGSSDRGFSAAIAAVPFAGLLVLLAFVMGLSAMAGGPGGCLSAESISGTLKGGVPKKFVPIYQRAAVKYHLGPKGPAMLASIHFNETTFGTNTVNTTGSGAMGQMMFMPETWAHYGVDADGDGDKDPHDPEDAIHSAARYLRASGAPGNWYDAIFAYNHADWYVEKILEDFRHFGGSGMEAVAASSGCAEAVAPNQKVARMIAEADRLSAMRPETEYVWSGSHGLTPTPRNGPFDCSSAVSHLLQEGGFKNPTMTTVGFHTWGKPGRGQWVTILNKPFEPEAHVILRFEPGVTPPSKRYWGTSGFIEGGGKGPGWIPQSTFDAGYLSRFEERHPPGL